MNVKKIITLAITFFALSFCCQMLLAQSNTAVTISGDDFLINGKSTYEGRMWKGHRVEGLLLNSRMVQGTFDDENPETVGRWVYPDDSLWSADRNTSEFIVAMEEWAAHGLNSFTLNMQGGSPMGYGNKNWHNTAFDPQGHLKEDYMRRLSMILDKADELNMIVILGYFYFGQDQFIEDETAVINATKNATQWLLDRNYQNVIVEVNNECDIPHYEHEILTEHRIHELVVLVKSIHKDGRRLLVGTSYGGASIPLSNVVEVSDFQLIHGNAVEQKEKISEMISQTRAVEGYKEMPIVFNEDDHYDFDNEDNNFVRAVQGHVSWGFFDFRRDGEPFEDGFQSVPVDWQISSPRKKAFFNMVKEVSGY